MSGIILADVATNEQWFVDTTPNVLDQGIFWHNEAGEEIQIAEMSKWYARSCVNFLAKRAYALLHREVTETMEALEGPLGPRGDMASYYAEAEFDSLCRANPLEWLNEKPLMQALKARAA